MGGSTATNVINPIVSVITSVGLDHVITLGPTIADIAWHKAGIIKPGATVVVGELSAEALSVIAEEAKAPPRWTSFGPLNMTSRRLARRQEHAHSKSAMRMWRLPWRWCSVSGDSGFRTRRSGAGIESARLPGRLERMPGTAEPAVWIDGAHNEDKIAAVTQEAIRRSAGGRCQSLSSGCCAARTHRGYSPSSFQGRRASSSRSRSSLAGNRWRWTRSRTP